MASFLFKFKSFDSSIFVQSKFNKKNNLNNTGGLIFALNSNFKSCKIKIYEYTKHQNFDKYKRT